MERKGKSTKKQLEQELAKVRIELAERKLLDNQHLWMFSRVSDERWKLDTIFSCLPHGVTIIANDFKILFQNKWSQDRFGNQKQKHCYQGLMQRNKPCPECPLKKALSNQKTEQCEIKTQDGRHLEIIASPMGKFDGKLALVEIVIDVTEQRRTEEAIFRAQQKYVDLINNLNVGVYRSTPDPQGEFLEVNPAMVTIFEAFSKEELLKVNPDILYQNSKKCREIIHKLMKFGYVKDEEFEMITLQGKKFWANTTAVRKNDRKGRIYFDGVIEDITERKQAEAEVRRLNKELQDTNQKLRQSALRDPHTGLHNYRYLTEIIEAELSRAKRHLYPFSVAMLDIRDFRSINIRHGYEYGDAALIKFSQTLKKTLRFHDIVTRFGGEKFVVILSRADEHQANLICQRLVEILEKENVGSRKSPLHMNFAAGIACYPKHRVSKGMELVTAAEMALVKAKKKSSA